MTRFVQRGRSRSMQATGAGGRFVKNTLENTAGLRLVVCPNPECRRFNPYGPTVVDGFVQWNPPERCHACDAALSRSDPELIATYKQSPGPESDPFTFSRSDQNIE